MEWREEEEREEEEYWDQISFLSVCFNYPSYIVCIHADVRLCVENRGSASARLCCFSTLLHSCLFIFLLKVFLPSPSTCCQDKDVTLQTGATKRARKKNKLLSASRGSNRWEVKLKRRKKHTFCQALENTNLFHGRKKNGVSAGYSSAAAYSCCVQMQFFHPWRIEMAIRRWVTLENTNKPCLNSNVCFNQCIQIESLMI